jgi:hypothetical protein
MRSRIDQANLLAKISDWQATSLDDHIFYRPYIEDESLESPININDDDDKPITFDGAGRSGLLLIHQTAWHF